MGSRTAGAPLVMLLALLNVRLGFWAPTPSGDRWREPRATLSAAYLLREFLSQTTDVGTYCYLTDGGHFDNTGLHALVERGCRYIVLLDCGADPRPQFDDVGEAIRRCRIDFGTEIDLDVQDFLPAASRTARRGEETHPGAGTGALGLRHAVAGHIRYLPEHWAQLGLEATDEAGRTGVIVWIKPAVTAASAADVRQYAMANAQFPQQTTADQWFDEAQFESYRRLGYESVRAAFGDERIDRLSAPAVSEFFGRVSTSLRASRGGGA